VKLYLRIKKVSNILNPFFVVLFFMYLILIEINNDYILLIIL